MASVIKIKRSGTANGSPGSLKYGELAYSWKAGVGKLYFGQGDDGNGNATDIVEIGGKFFTDMLDHTPGVLTTSSAIITDAFNKIDNLKVDNIDLNGNTISTLDSNGNLILAPNGSGKISFYNAYTFPTTAGAAGYALVSDGAGGLTWAGVSTASTATNIAGGAAGQIPIQTSAGVTSFISAGIAGQLLQAGNNTATFVSTTTVYVGRAVDADKWTTARTITLAGDLGGSASFDGSTNFTLTATIQAGSVTLGTDTSGDYVGSGATSGFGISGSASGANSTFTVTSNATSTNTANTIVFRDGSGNFSAATITAATAFSGTLGTGGAQSINTNALSLSGYADNGGILYFSNGSGLIASNSANFAWDSAAGVLRVKTTTTSFSTTTGALVVTGGVGIGGNLYVGGEIVAQKLTIEYTTVTTSVVTTDDVIKTTNTTESNNTTSGALQIAGGAGIGGNLYVGGVIFGTINGSITTATNLAGGTAGQLVYQSATGVTAFYGPGSTGEILTSNGTNGPVYSSTSSIYVGRSVIADKWTTARTVTFTGDTTGTFTIDGSADVTNVNLTIQPNSVELGTDTTGNYLASGATAGFGLSGSSSSEGGTFTVTSNATSTNSANTIVFRDANGDFAARVITGDLVGTASSANDLTGGTAGDIPYQSAAGVTVFLPVGLGGKILQVSTATNLPVWGDIDGGIY